MHSRSGDIDLPPIVTERLVLRPIASGDAPAITAALQEWDVVRWVTSVPWPYSLADAEWFIGEASAGRVSALAITEHDSLLGIVSADVELGYWLSKPHWGRGIMTEAANALLHRFFEDPARDSVASGYLIGNARSAGVLTKLGFVETGPSTRPSRATGKDEPCMELHLSRECWMAKH